MQSEITDIRTVSIGRVFARTFEVMWTNPIVAFGVTFLFGTLPQLIINYPLQTMRLNLRMGAASADAGLALMGVGLLSMLVMLALAALVQGSLVEATLAASDGRKASFQESVGIGLRRLLPLIVVGLLFGIAFVIGFVLLIVPAFIIATMWVVAAPVVVAENAGIGRSFGRSRELTAGSRWKIFGMFLVVGVVLMLVGWAQLWLTLASGVSPLEAPFSPPILLINAVISTISTSFFSIIASALYVELRNAREGAPAEKLGEIFG